MPSVPVLLYHYITTRRNSIAVHPERFEEHLWALTRSGFATMDAHQALEYFARGRTLPGKRALVTFDDGFLDNYVHAWPLLKKHGHKGVVFAVTERIEQGPVRPGNLDVAAGKAAPDELPPVDTPHVADELGFLNRRDLFINWDEARRMQREGGIEVQAHTHRHVSVFTGPKFSGVFEPAARSRTFDRVDACVPFGLPRFAVGPSLAERAFVPSDELYAMCEREVPQSAAEAKAFFAAPGNREGWQRRLAELSPERLGSYESEEDHQRRVRADLAACAETFVRETGAVPPLLAWPWGASTRFARRTARELGFKVFFDVSVGPNPPGRAEHVHRFKAKDKPGPWMRSRLAVYSRPLLARAYALTHR